ncbi:MAG: DUF86 domain-containing protein [Planctomycetes bacterium]|nr:DUF86 domain-containing protein [Planctomycetota bacterium]
MRHDARVVLHDAITAAARIDEVMRNVTEKQFIGDWMLQSMVERQCMIVGEALGRLRKFHPELSEGIHHADELVDFRNMLAHAYDRVDPRLVYSLAHLHLQKLHGQLQRVLHDLNADPAGSAWFSKRMHRGSDSPRGRHR